VSHEQTTTLVLHEPTILNGTRIVHKERYSTGVRTMVQYMTSQ